MLLARDSFPGTLRIDKNGEPHGTGKITYRYANRQIAQQDHYSRGRLTRRAWFRPDGSLIANEQWAQGTGWAYRIREDGSVRAKIHYVNDAADGTATYFAADGSVLGEAAFRAGTRVEGFEPPQEAAPAFQKEIN